MSHIEPYNLNLAASQFSPSVDADWQSGCLRMGGESYPENTYDFFSQVTTWMQRFLASDTKPLRLELHLSYLNTSSVRAMIDIFDNLQEASDQGRKVSVLWLYDNRNPRAAELGEEFKEDYTFPFAIEALPVD